MKNTERVSYIRGLAEGLELDEDKKEVKVLNAIIDLLDDMAVSMSELEDNVSDIADQLDAVDEDLGSLEDDFYDDGEEDEEDDEEKDEDEDSEAPYEVTCPHCNETVSISADLAQEGKIQCPNCGETIEFDVEGGDEDSSRGHDDEDDEN